MLGLLASSPLLFFLVEGALVICLTIHEFAHAWTADFLGDPTPRLQGRVTLNPLAHLDPLGTFLIVVTGFGWGRPVQFDPYNLKNGRRDIALIALAGPASNLILAFVLALLGAFLPLPALFTSILITINVGLAIFNLLPVYPLDGSKILEGLLPPRTALEYSDFMQRYGLFVLLALLLPWGNSGSPAHAVLDPIVDVILRLLSWI